LIDSGKKRALETIQIKNPNKVGILHINSNDPSQLSQWLCCRTASIVVVIITVIISNSYNSKKYSLPPRCKDSQANWNTNILVAALLLPLLTPSVKAIWTSSNWRTPLTLECYRHRRLNTLTAWFSTHTSCNHTKQISPLIASQYDIKTSSFWTVRVGEMGRPVLWTGGQVRPTYQKKLDKGHSKYTHTSRLCIETKHTHAAAIVCLQVERLASW